MTMAHEDLTRIHEIEGSSSRAFGLMVCGLCLVVAFWPLIGHASPRWWGLGLAIVSAATAIFKPALLAGPNRIWIKLGLLLGKIVSPIALGLVFYCIVTPIGTLVRLTGKDPLRLKLDSRANSYWILREPPGPPPNSMNNQF